MDEPNNFNHTNTKENTQSPSTEPQPLRHTPAQSMPGAFELFGPSVTALMRNLWVVILFAAIPVFILIILMVTNLSARSVGSEITMTSVNTISLIGGLVAITLAFIFAPALTYTQLRSAEGLKVTFGEAFSNGLKYLLRYIGLSIIVALLIIGGFLLLIIPGFIMLRRYFLSVYYLVDEDLGVFEAMKKSADSTKPYSWKIYGIIGVNLLFALPSVIPILGQLVGSLLQFLYSFAPAVRYHQVKDAFYGANEDMLGAGSQAPMPPSAQPPVPPAPIV